MKKSKLLIHWHELELNTFLKIVIISIEFNCGVVDQSPT